MLGCGCCSFDDQLLPQGIPALIDARVEQEIDAQVVNVAVVCSTKSSSFALDAQTDSAAMCLRCNG